MRESHQSLGSNRKARPFWGSVCSALGCSKMRHSSWFFFLQGKITMGKTISEFHKQCTVFAYMLKGFWTQTGAACLRLEFCSHCSSEMVLLLQLLWCLLHLYHVKLRHGSCRGYRFWTVLWILNNKCILKFPRACYSGGDGFENAACCLCLFVWRAASGEQRACQHFK